MFGKKKEFEEPGVNESITDVQKELSKEREESAKKIEAMTGMPGHLDFDYETVDGKTRNVLKGEVKGHSIEVFFPAEEYADYSGTVDGKKITSSDAYRLREKFISVAYRKEGEAGRLGLEMNYVKKQEEDKKIRQETGSVVDELLN